MSLANRALYDPFGRRFTYLRLSITDACGFRCFYCLPQGYRKKDDSQPLSGEEIRRLVEAFAEMGTSKVRLTGGEPTLRRDFLEIARGLKRIPGIRQLAISTNGHRLKELAPRMREAGIDRVNVSVDSLDPGKFAEITGMDVLDSVLEGIETSLGCGFQEVKVNAVLLKDWNESEFALFQDWVKERPISVRFIELMPTAHNPSILDARGVRSTALRAKLLAEGWSVRPRRESDGPAEEFTHGGYLGRMGIIAPYSEHFCSSCNRLRVSSRGGLRLCLFGEGDHSVRELLQSDGQKEELKDRVAALLGKKEISHYLPEGRYGINHSFSAIGG